MAMAQAATKWPAGFSCRCPLYPNCPSSMPPHKISSTDSLETRVEKTLVIEDATDAIKKLGAGPQPPSTDQLDYEKGTSTIAWVLKMLLRFKSAKDLVSTRLSLPTNLLHPTSQLEFWNYNDRPDLMASLSDPEDSLDRFLGVVRWWYSKDTKWKTNTMCKPFNPILGERFLCEWRTLVAQPPGHNGVVEPKHVTVQGIQEQISHHPPVCAYYYDCPEKGVVIRGLDQIMARFTGTQLKVGPGECNHGIYVTLTKRDEEYLLTHPWASVAGFITGSLYITVSETTVIVCPKTGLKAVLEYKPEPFFGRPKFAIEGKIFRHDYKADEGLTEKERKESEKLAKIPESLVLATVSGQWNGRVYFRKTGEDHDTLLFDMTESEVARKIVKPIGDQDPLESQRVWGGVTSAMLEEDFQTATKLKRQLEDEQRALSRGRNEPFVSSYFRFELPPLEPATPESIRSMEGGKPYLK
ncbi:uncharacterized protein BJ171DRAFT_501194 [Polychytrium aggregatum]|uniref:uncharacterized protein n=1 Tax=Polychytrium aggregatum TaxID=110093 RepID=UPI0022FECC71|nr:uncharacterized protein BJ171DRAFT_501194 [Polychytrium aggregatum]KAI9205693.1 hypothetical protein BJ171DRAFT_501194 [Polychytrium aggregatum]